MNIDDFVNHSSYGRGPIRVIDDVINKWNEELTGVNDGDGVGTATMLAALGLDAAVGDGLLNQVSPDLLHSMTNLMGEKADTYEEARQLIAKQIANGDHSFAGFVSKIKGQLGEDQFVKENAEYVLAISKSQEGVDAMRGLGSGFVEAVQVKMYQNANQVIQHMRVVQQKVSDGLTVQGESIDKLSFAVPYDIADKVRSDAAQYADLSAIEIIPVGVTSKAVAEVVKQAGDNISHPYLHIAGDAFSTIGLMVALDALTNTYLCVKGKKTLADVARDITVKTPIGALAIGTSKTTAVFLSLAGWSQSPIVLPIISAFIVRKLTLSWYEHRSSFSVRVNNDCQLLTLLCDALAAKAQPKFQFIH